MDEDRIVRFCGVKFKRPCSVNWDLLEPTADDKARHCRTCDQDVHLCVSDEETMQHAEQGHCIARPIPSDSELPRMVLGRVDAVVRLPTAAQEAALRVVGRERDIARSLDDWRFSKRRCTACGYPVADWLVSCNVCGSKEFRVAGT
jgi:hypothetical protein